MFHLHVTATPLDSGTLAPLDALRIVAQRAPGDYVLLHSAAGDSPSVIGFDPLCRIIIDAAGHAHLTADAVLLPSLPPLPDLPPLQALQTLVQSLRFAQLHPLVGWLGFLSYDIARFLESIGHSVPDDLHCPLIHFTLFRRYVVFDADTTTAFTLGQPDNFHWEIFSHPLPPPTATPHSVLLQQQSPADYKAKINRVKQYIAAGDIYQANLAQRWKVQTNLPPHEAFIRLCQISPAPFAACLRITPPAGNSLHVVSASPELFLNIQPDGLDRLALTSPIKGTRPRDLTNPARDAALREELLASPKDRAELTMIVDLLRNDLGRVSDFGTVRVLDPRELQAHPTVWHTLATISSRLRPDASLADILAALCPGGSITGAPKIRAMQIINELEGFRRGLYCGNIGILGDNAHSLLLNIAIRTILFQNDHAYLYAGGGIVADSDPHHEYEETLHKARAMFQALGLHL